MVGHGSACFPSSSSLSNTMPRSFSFSSSSLPSFAVCPIWEHHQPAQAWLPPQVSTPQEWESITNVWEYKSGNKSCLGTSLARSGPPSLCPSFLGHKQVRLPAWEANGVQFFFLATVCPCLPVRLFFFIPVFPQKQEFCHTTEFRSGAEVEFFFLFVFRARAMNVAAF